MPKLLCFGDVHLGAGSDYGRTPGDRLRDQAAVLDQIAELAVEEAVDGVLCAGDIFEGPAIPPEQLDAFAHFIARLQMRIPVLSVVGNSKHDAAMRATNGLKIFGHIPGVQISSTPDVYRFAGCAVSTLPWVSPARLIAQRGGGDRDEIHAEVAQLLVDIAQRGREDCARVAPGAPAILLGHWSVSGSSLPNGLPVDQLREPVIPFTALQALGYDALVFGHIHAPQDWLADGVALRKVFVADGETPGTTSTSFYVGSPMPLNFGEAKSAHGVWILDLPGGSSSSVRPAAAADGQSNGQPGRHDLGSTPGSCSTFHPIQSRRFVTIDFDCTDELQARWLASAIEHPSMIDPALVDDAIVRFRYRASAEQQRSIDTADLRRQLLDAGAAVVKIQPDIVRADRARVEGLDESVDELQGLDLYVAANDVDAQLAALMRDRTRHYLETAAA